ncbi:MAG: Outer membrane adhesin-like protein [Candidatus Uhrbacteria bacterium GW2011_GWF2_39_13]|uniref:Outer membrane adhesin-like protein n=1 Tax=Candidatus Uhrbacteria bacterium GW2011_GWF2_39_13 TaxID=1618995 RepID=A0A0G0QMK7_9BACT|nr:MAG: Outer membrane adhesin-like protein [Candidatus Uhrbacteria bacterium GW2011_GWF2_39_13]
MFVNTCGDGICWYKDDSLYGDKYLITKENNDGSRKVYIADTLGDSSYESQYIGTISQQDWVDIKINGTKSLDYSSAFNTYQLQVNNYGGSDIPSKVDTGQEFKITAGQVVVGVATAVVVAGIIIVLLPEETILALGGAGVLAVRSTLLALLEGNAGRILGKGAEETAKKGALDITFGIIPSIAGFFNTAISTVAPTPEVPRHDPLILDLDGDGIETTNLTNGGYFDHDENGFAETSAWVGIDDGVLAMDLDEDGIINNGSELIETFTDLSIDTNDTDFANLKVLKGDGSFMTISEAGIKSISLTYSNVNITDANGNQQISLKKAA